MRQSKGRINDKGEEEEVKRLKGDGLYLKMNSNHGVLEITGDGCMVTLAKNSGVIRIVGDGSHLKVSHNVGDIMYKGDGGHVSLGPESSKERVTYIGDGGQITFDTSPKKTSLKNVAPQRIEIFRTTSTKEKPKKKCNEETGKINSLARSSVKSNKDAFDMAKRIGSFHHSIFKERNENGEKTNERSEHRRDHDAISPEMENRRNERKEAERRGERNEDAVIVTKFVTTQSNGQSVKKWFVRPASVIKPLDGPIKIIARKPRVGTEES